MRDSAARLDGEGGNDQRSVTRSGCRPAVGIDPVAGATRCHAQSRDRATASRCPARTEAACRGDQGEGQRATRGVRRQMAMAPCRSSQRMSQSRTGTGRGRPLGRSSHRSTNSRALRVHSTTAWTACPGLTPRRATGSSTSRSTSRADECSHGAREECKVPRPEGKDRLGTSATAGSIQQTA